MFKGSLLSPQGKDGRTLLTKLTYEMIDGEKKIKTGVVSLTKMEVIG